MNTSCIFGGSINPETILKGNLKITLRAYHPLYTCFTSDFKLSSYLTLFCARYSGFWIFPLSIFKENIQLKIVGEENFLPVKFSTDPYFFSPKHHIFNKYWCPTICQELDRLGARDS